MSRFLEYFKSKVIEGGIENINMFSVAELQGENAINGFEKAEKIEFIKNNPCQDVYSVAKSFTATAIGILIERNLLSFDEIVTDIIEDELPENIHPYWYETTVGNVINRQIGLPGSFLDIDAYDATEWGNDYLKYMLTYPLSCKPGTEYHYNDAAYYLLSVIIEKKAKMPLDNFLWKELFHPLGFREAAWSHCPKGHAMGATGLYIRVEDMVKYGALYLNGGVWQNKRILSEEWVKFSIEKGLTFRKNGIGESYSKGGMREQLIVVIPEEKRVVAWQSFRPDDDVQGFIRIASEYRDNEEI
jgi:CubicO group peptidase (beta-lactamase class C family)